MNGAKLEDLLALITGRYFKFLAGTDLASVDLIAPRISFEPEGRILGYRNSNEACWRIQDDRLHLIRSDGSTSCIFDGYEIQDEKLIMSGLVLPQRNGRHHFLVELERAHTRLNKLPSTLVFEGEFGEEVNSFIPYVYWLSKNGEMQNRNIETYSGMEPFYFFLDSKQKRFVTKPRIHVPANRTPGYYLHLNGLNANQTGMELAPDYRTEFKIEFGFRKPILVVHNKYTEEWGGAPVNFLTPELLEAIFEKNKARFQIIFFEAARSAHSIRGYSLDHQPLIEYNDVEIARRHPEVMIFGDMLQKSEDSYNLLKLKVFSSSHHFLTVQGGTAHLCALFPGSLVAILHIRGREEAYAYSKGTFQFLTNPRPIYLIAREGKQLVEILGAFDDCNLCLDRVHLGPKGIELYTKYDLGRPTPGH